MDNVVPIMCLPCVLGPASSLKASRYLLTSVFLISYDEVVGRSLGHIRDVIFNGTLGHTVTVVILYAL